MIRIGKHISLLEQATMTNGTTEVFFKGELLGGIRNIKMEWNADSVVPIKHCSIISLKKEIDPVVEEFAMEMGKYGFWVEIEYPVIGKFVEFYHVREKQEREEKCGAKDSLHRE